MFKDYISLKGKLLLILFVIFEKNGALINEKTENRAAIVFEYGRSAWSKESS